MTPRAQLVVNEIEDIKVRLSQLEAQFLEEEEPDEEDRKAMDEASREPREKKTVLFQS